MNALAPDTTTTRWPMGDWAQCIGRLPSMPGAFIAAVDVLSRDDVPAAACIEAIERDQALTVRMLRLANSSFYGAPGQVSRVGDAVQMLGLRTVASTLAAISLRAMLGALRCEGFSFETYWRHSLCTAISARELARLVSLDAGQAFLLGLLHDVGKLILAMTSPALEAQALQRCRREGVSLHEAEREVFGVSHAEVGAAVARQWDFPARIADAIAGHHSPAPIPPGERLDLCHLLPLANRLAHALEGTETGCAPLLASPPWSAMFTSEQRLHDLTGRISDELDIMSCA